MNCSLPDSNQCASARMRALSLAPSFSVAATKPIVIDLFCGLGGFTDGFLAEGYTCYGFDVERHRYPRVSAIKDPESASKQSGMALKLGEGRPCGAGFNVANEKAYSDALRRGFTEWQEYPGQLILQDVRTIHGSQFRNAACIVASPPCQEFSYLAMPWSRGKQIAKALRGEGEFPEGYTGSRTIAEMTALFDACFRIQREACEAAGRYIPMVVENVKGAQPWVGPAKANYGSFYLWGDVGMVGNRVVCRTEFGNYTAPIGRAAKVPGMNWSGSDQPGYKAVAFNDEAARQMQAGRKVPGLNFHEHEKTGKPGRSFQSAAVDGTKATAAHAWFNDHKRNGVELGNESRLSYTSSRSSARKAASAQIAKIPFGLSSYVARCFWPAGAERVA